MKKTIGKSFWVRNKSSVQLYEFGSDSSPKAKSWQRERERENNLLQVMMLHLFLKSKVANTHPGIAIKTHLQLEQICEYFTSGDIK